MDHPPELSMVLKVICLVLVLLFSVHLASCIWFAIGKAHEVSWLIPYYTGQFFNDYIVSVHPTVAQLQSEAGIYLRTLCTVILVP